MHTSHACSAKKKHVTKNLSLSHLYSLLLKSILFTQSVKRVLFTPPPQFKFNFTITSPKKYCFLLMCIPGVHFDWVGGSCGGGRLSRIANTPPCHDRFEWSGNDSSWLLSFEILLAATSSPLPFPLFCCVYVKIQTYHTFIITA